MYLLIERSEMIQEIDRIIHIQVNTHVRIEELTPNDAASTQVNSFRKDKPLLSIDRWLILS